MSEYIDAPSTPRISLVMPNYNSGPVLERAIRSVLDQHYPNLQLIMADGASRDESRAVIDRFRDRFDVVIQEPDRGQADGLNRGFRHADGEIFGWLCADDELMPGALEHVAGTFARHPDADVLSGGCERVVHDGVRFVVPARPDAWAMIGMQNVIEQPATFWRGELHRRLGELDRSYDLGFDWDFWCRMRDVGARLVTSETLLARYYFTETNKSGSAGPLFAEEAYRLIKARGPLGGRLADVYRFIYRHFDRRGCLDKPPTASPARMAAYLASCAVLRVAVGRDRLRAYNWHFAVLQERGEKWWT